MSAEFGTYLKHARRGKCRAGAHFVVKFISTVACFSGSFSIVASVLLFAELSGFDFCASLHRAHVTNAKVG